MTGRPGGIVLDMEGVLHVDWQPIEGSTEAVHELRRRGIELAILTNTTGRTRAAITWPTAAIWSGVAVTPPWPMPVTPSLASVSSSAARGITLSGTG